MTEFRLRKGAVLRRHAHPHEPTGYWVKGRIRLLIRSEEYEAQAGDRWRIPGGLEHRTHFVEGSVAIEVVSPSLPVCQTRRSAPYWVGAI